MTGFRSDAEADAKERAAKSNLSGFFGMQRENPKAAVSNKPTQAEESIRNQPANGAFGGNYK